MLQRNKFLTFISFTTFFASILGLGVNFYSYISNEVFMLFFGLLCIAGLIASVLLHNAYLIGKYITTLFWLSQSIVVGVGGIKIGFSFAFAISLHFNLTLDSYVVINLVGVIMAALCLLKLNKYEVKAQTVRT